MLSNGACLRMSSKKILYFDTLTDFSNSIADSIPFSLEIAAITEMAPLPRCPQSTSEF